MAVELDWPNWPGFTPRAMAEFEAYAWPGNVRELRNVVERAVYRHEDPERPVDEIQFNPFHSPWSPSSADTVQTHAAAAATDSSEEVASVAHIVPSAAAAPSAPTSDFRAAVAAYERELLEDALRRNRFNQRATAAALKRHKLQDTAA
jgi:psp operon transcriptional activator